MDQGIPSKPRSAW